MINSPYLIFRNPLLMPAVVAWFSAQLIKVVLTLIFSKRLDFRRIVGSGGMPSSHTSFVVALAVSAGMRHGWDSSVFAICAALASIVMSDAAGVRRAAGRQAAMLNRIVRSMPMEDMKVERHDTLIELLGHTPVEVIAGAILGSLVSVLFAYRMQ